jgi:hypothetical protein
VAKLPSVPPVLSSAPIDLDAAATAAHHALTATLSEFVGVAAGAGADGLARSLAGTVACSDRGALLDALGRALQARGDPGAVAARLEVLDRVRGLVVRFDDLLVAVAADACRPLDPPSPLASSPSPAPAPAPMVDLASTERQDRAMPTPTTPGAEPVAVPPRGRKRGGKTPPPPASPIEPTPPALPELLLTADEVAALVESGNDEALIDLAAGYAGSQATLAKLMGLRKESITRVRSGTRRTGFSPASRAWLRDYCTTPASPPPPLPGGAGPKARPDAVAPQVRMTSREYTAFRRVATASFESQVCCVEWAIRTYLDRHPEPVPALTKVAPGTKILRTRIDPTVLHDLDARVGLGARAAHIRAALAECLPLVVADPTIAAS